MKYYLADAQARLVSILCILMITVSAFASMGKSNYKYEASKGYAVGRAVLGMPFDEFVKYVSFDNIDKQNGYWILYRNNEKLLSIYDKGDSNFKVRDIEVYSSEYTLIDGIRVGMSVESLRQIYSKYKITSDVESGGYVFYPGKLQSKTLEGKPDICFGLILKITDKDSLKYLKNHLKNSSAISLPNSVKIDGVVESVSIYYWK